jgi:hypothetical protein
MKISLADLKKSSYKVKIDTETLLFHFSQEAGFLIYDEDFIASDPQTEEGIDTKGALFYTYRDFIHAEFGDDRCNLWVSDKDKATMKSIEIVFTTGYEEAKAFMTTINKLSYKDRERNCAVLVNPISGRWLSTTYYRERLQPMFEKVGLRHTMFETESETYMDEWVGKISFATLEFTDFIIIGGDGLFIQLLNAIHHHKDRKKLFKVPIGLVPGGSQNGTAVDLGAKMVNHGITNVLWGVVIPGDAFTFKSIL